MGSGGGGGGGGAQGSSGKKTSRGPVPLKFGLGP